MCTYVKMHIHSNHEGIKIMPLITLSYPRRIYSKDNFVTMCKLASLYATYLLTYIKNSLVPVVESYSVLYNKAQLFDLFYL